MRRLGTTIAALVVLAVAFGAVKTPLYTSGLTAPES
jgi:hypothetical protein